MELCECPLLRWFVCANGEDVRHAEAEPERQEATTTTKHGLLSFRHVLRYLIRLDARLY